MYYEVINKPKEQHYDAFGRLKASAILYFAQEAAGAHAGLLGTGRDVLLKKNLFWAVIRTKAEILAQPEKGEPITVRTWPLPTTRTAYPRCVMGYDRDGKLLFKVLSLWVLMDVNSRTMVLPGKSGVVVEGNILGGEPESPRVLPSKELTDRVRRTVGVQQLDVNGHMNNTKYMDWVMELMQEDRAVKGFDLCYFNEARLDDEMDLDYSFADDILTVDIHRRSTDVTDKKDRIFAASVRF